MPENYNEFLIEINSDIQHVLEIIDGEVPREIQATSLLLQLQQKIHDELEG